MTRSADMSSHPVPSALPIDADLHHVVQGVGAGWDQLRNSAIFVTGGTGIVGKWLLATVLRANRERGLNLRVDVLSRHPARFAAQHPELACDPCLRLIAGDVRTAELPDTARYSHLIHAATDVVDAPSPHAVFDTCVQGTRTILDAANRWGVQRLLLLSSGAVYGKTPPGLLDIPETFHGSVDSLSPASAYAEGKRVSELLCAFEQARGRMAIPVARCFAMVGPWLPLDRHFAIGNFIGAALRNEPVIVRGDGTPIRSYLYLADVALQLWRLLFDGRGGVACNVGGTEALSIEALARRVIRVLGVDVPIRIENHALREAHADRYCPDTRRIRGDLDLADVIPLDQAIARTAAWHRSLQPHAARTPPA